MKARVAVLAAVLVALVAMGVRAVRASRAELAAAAVCDALARGDVEAAAAGVPPPSALSPALDDASMRALDCGCHALLLLGDRGGCVTRLERVLVPAETAWPASLDARLALPVADAWMERGEHVRAARVIRAASARAPNDDELFAREVETTAMTDGPDALDQLARNLPANAYAQRITLANAELDAFRPAPALAVLGEVPPAVTTLLPVWFTLRGRSLAALRQNDAVAANFRAAEGAGVPHAIAAAEHAAALANAELGDPALPALLEDAVQGIDGVPDRDLARYIAYKWLQVAQPRLPPAVAAQQAKRLLALFPELAKAAPPPSDDHRGAGPGVVVFHAPVDGAVLAVREDHEELDPERVPVAGGVARLERSAKNPLRWTFVDDSGAVRASGIAWPHQGSAVDVTVVLRAAPPAPEPPRARKAGDGHRRVFAVLLDSGDWRVVQALRARGEMPTLDALIARGVRATLRSVPATTSAALRKIVFPSAAVQVTAAQEVSDLGAQLAAAVGGDDNPLAGFLWLAPPEQTFFSVLGAKGRSAANFLFGSGGMRAGRHGDVVMRDGSLRHLAPPESRPLLPAELAADPRLGKGGLAEQLALRQTAALFDTLDELARDDDVDVVLARVDATDTVAHLTFSELLTAGQDDGDRLLYGIYAYCDRRLGELMGELDEDDVVVVFSDHGTRTAFEHDERAMFVAAGGGLAPGVVAGEPDMNELPASLAVLAGVDVDWPKGPLTTALSPGTP